MKRSLRRRAIATGLLAIVLGGCNAILESPPTPNPEPFPGIVGLLGKHGVTALSWTAGDAGCDDPTLAPTAIRFDADGLDQATPLTLRIYIFRSREAWDRRLADVDRCFEAWASDPATFESMQISPYVVAGQGPWPPGFEEGLRKGITEAAGNGG